MTNIIAHRGPDDEGFLSVSKNLQKAIHFGGPHTAKEVFESSLPYNLKGKSHVEGNNTFDSDISILLGHRRLSIVDLSAAGHQPMCTSDGYIWMAYNGEVYNHPEIRRELTAYGYSFHSQTDTEVILTAYKHWGSACLHKFNGMFAFIIIDLAQKRLFAARDRFGVKPLYFWRSSAGFLAFASEIKQFTTLPGWEAQANLSRSIDYLAYGLTDFSNETLFSKVFQLRGGESIECSLNLFDTFQAPLPKRWYHLNKNPQILTFEEAKAQFYFLFEDAVRLRLRADVDIGSCLSGGLDSSAIVCMMHQLLKEEHLKQGQQKTFSACSHIPRLNERHFMDIVIQKTNVEGHFVIPSLDHLLNTTKQIVWQQDEPFGSSSIFAQYLVFEAAQKAGVKVMLDGQGADELLAGYGEFWMAYLAQMFKAGQWRSLLAEYKAAKQMNSLNRISTIGIFKQLLPSKAKHHLKSVLFNTPLAHFIFPWINHHKGYQSCYIENPKNVSHQVDQLSFNQLLCTNLPALLRYEDRNSMAHSIEARTPFLDYRLVELIFNLPAHYKISQGYTKKILRETIDIVPEKIRRRTDKIGFATAEEAWMCDENPALFRREIAGAIAKSHGLINAKALQLADDMLFKKIPFDWTLWRIINFGYWMEIYKIKRIAEI